MTAENIALVVADIHAGRVKRATKRDDIFDLARQVWAAVPPVVVDATAIYQDLLVAPKEIALYEDHPSLMPPWESFALCYQNEHGNVVVMHSTVVERRADDDEPWETDTGADWDKVRWVVHTFVWCGGFSGEEVVPTHGPRHMWQSAIYEDGQPADLHWVQLIPEYPLEHWDMAHLVLLQSINFLNCFTGDTPIVTDEGVVPIGKLAGRDVQVLSRMPSMRSAAAKFVPARIESFGRQPIVELVVRRNGARKTIRTTAGHRWFVRRKGGTDEKRTTELAIGDALVTVRPRSRAETCHISGIGVAHGLVYGDGTRPRSPDGCNIEIFGDDRRDMLRFFPEPHVAERERSLFVTHLPRAFKDLPPEDESSPYLYSFLAGWFAADGHVDRTGSITLSNAQRGPLDWVHRVALTKLGIVTGEPKMKMRMGIDGKVSPLWSIRFDRGSLRASFFVRRHHRDRFAERKIKPEPNHWIVERTRPTGEVEEVFCAVVPGTESFVLDGMILTGNCRNVDIVEPVRPRGERRRIERTGVKVHTINVFKAGTSTRAVKGEAVGSVPLHPVRGHAAHYGNCCPGVHEPRGRLFGKLEGKFWVPQHLRGNSEHGENRPDYRLVTEGDR